MAFASIADIMDALPMLLFIAQIVMNVILAWVFGSVAFRGMQRKMAFTIRIPAMLATGFVCLLFGAGVRQYLFFLQGTPFNLIQLDLFIGGLIAAITAAIGLYLITRNRKDEEESTTIAKLKESVKLLEGLLVKEKVQTLKEDEVKKTAESLLPGFSAKKASLKNTEWEILLEKDKKQALATLGAYTGEVKKIEHLGAKDPYMIAGICIIIALIVLSVLTFRSLPSFAEGVASLMGMDEAQFNALIGNEQLPAGCVSTVRILMKQGVNIVGSDTSFKDESVVAMVEGETGRKVAMMYTTVYDGKEFILSITFPRDMNVSEGETNDDIMQKAEICSSTADTFCDCIKIPELSRMTTGFMVAVDRNKISR